MLHVSERPATAPDFMAGGGEMGRRMRDKDWTGHALGPPASWPAPLQAALRIVLASRQPLALWWGADCALFFNDACRPLVGADPDDALGAPVPSEWLDRADLAATGPGGEPLSYALASSPVPGEGGSLGGVLCTFVDRDIDRLKRVENELRELDQRKNEFLATLAHELRNPLAPLRNGLEVLRLAGTDPATATKAREMMERQLAQMVRLVDDLLDVSRVSRGQIDLRREDVALGDVLRNAVETSQPLIAERRHELVLDLPREGAVVHADFTRLSQVFWNLLNNAARYTEPGGRIEVSMREAGADVEVSVRDNGVGIPGPMQQRVFDLFTQVDRTLEKSHGGLGIGLTLAKRLVEMHGGSIRVSSAGHGQGTEFVVRLPARRDARTDARKRILVADDDPDSAATLALLLETAGNEVRVAHDGLAAVELAADFRPDVVLLDITMPRMNGYDACRFLRALPACNGAYVVALTGWAQDQDRRRTDAAGFDCHLVKPVEPEALQRLIREMPRKDAHAPAA